VDWESAVEESLNCSTAAVLHSTHFFTSKSSASCGILYFSRFSVSSTAEK